ncbi:hypothetical protein F5884DRAFT_129313 [Xylogone sp. PMI_703]|nr:hypothetical protein F5884DRAFT_129313 [Xylogone sp. PMI_703]
MSAAVPTQGQPRRGTALPTIPNFDLIAQSYQTLSTELAKCQHLPAIDNSVSILQAIQELGRGINRIDERIERMEMRLKAVDSNNIARLSNSMIIDADAELSTLRNIESDEPIDYFPRTPRDIAGLTGHVLNTILRALGTDVGGTMDARRKRLRVQIGLKADPV